MKPNEPWPKSTYKEIPDLLIQATSIAARAASSGDIFPIRGKVECIQCKHKFETLDVCNGVCADCLTAVIRRKDAEIAGMLFRHGNFIAALQAALVGSGIEPMTERDLLLAAATARMSVDAYREYIKTRQLERAFDRPRDPFHKDFLGQFDAGK